MPDTSGEGAACRRCGHHQQHPVATTTKLLRALRRKPARVRCGAPTDHGWECPCRSRFHTA